MSMGLNMPESDWTPIEDWPDLSNYPWIAYDSETRDPDLLSKGPGFARRDPRSYIIGHVLHVPDKTFYLPVRHEGGGNLPPNRVAAYVREQLSRPQQTKVMHNSSYDLEALKSENIDVIGPVFDTMVAESVIDEYRRSYSLDSVGTKYVGERKIKNLIQEASIAMGWGSHPRQYMSRIWELHSRYVGPYAEGDGDLTGKVYVKQLEEIEKQGLQEAIDLEMSLLKFHVNNRWRGVRVSVDRVEQLKAGWQKREKEIRGELTAKLGWNLDIWSPGSLMAAWRQENFQISYTDNGNPSFTKGEWAGNPHWLPKNVFKARELSNIISTFLDGMILGNMSSHGDEYRLHPQMMPTKSDEGGTVSYRYAYRDPNLQQAPGESMGIVGAEFRSCFLPEHGCDWLVADHSQQEPRVTVHFAAICGFPGAAEARQKFIDDPGTDFHQMVADMTGLDRKPAKTINLGITYGMMEATLAARLGVSRDEAKAILAQYNNNAPFISKLIEDVSGVANTRGWIRLAYGHHSRFPFWEPAEWGTKVAPTDYHTALKLQKDPSTKWYNKPLRRAYTHKALNRLVQGTSAEIIKHNLRNLIDAGYEENIILTVHDENDFNVNEEKQIKIFTDIMADVDKITVPMKIDAEIGPNWGDVKEYDLAQAA